MATVTAVDVSQILDRFEHGMPPATFVAARTDLADTLHEALPPMSPSSALLHILVDAIRTAADLDRLDETFDAFVEIAADHSINVHI